MSEKIAFYRTVRFRKQTHLIDGTELPKDQLFGFFEVDTGYSIFMIGLNEILNALKQEELKLLNKRINEIIKQRKENE